MTLGGNSVHVRNGRLYRNGLIALLALAPALAGCSGSLDQMQTDLSKDAQWFQRSGRAVHPQLLDRCAAADARQGR
jgi:hypothetical protein